MGIDLLTLALAKKYTDEHAGEGTVIPGKDGKSAYEIAVEHGFQGTEEEWLESLKGVGVPSGGTSGQVLIKESGDDYDVKWANEYDNLKNHSFDELDTNDKTLLGAINEILSALEIKEF